MTNTTPSRMPQGEQYPPRFPTGWLITIMSLVPSILFLLVYGHRGSPVWFYVFMLGGAGLVSASAIGWLANQLKLRRDIGSIVIFILIGVFIGPLLGGMTFCVITFAIVFTFHLPLSAFINSVLATFTYAMMALAVGLLVGCFLLPRNSRDEDEDEEYS